MSMGKIIWAVILSGIAVILPAAFMLYVKGMDLKANYAGARESVLEINGNVFKAEIASTARERSRGLSGRSSLCRECGMLFIFQEKGNYHFWMKDMQFDLDIVWIADSRIVGIEKNVSHARGRLRVARPVVKVDKVLELNAGVVDARGIKVGDAVKQN